MEVKVFDSVYISFMAPFLEQLEKVNWSTDGVFKSLLSAVLKFDCSIQRLLIYVKTHTEIVNQPYFMKISGKQKAIKTRHQVKH